MQKSRGRWSPCIALLDLRQHRTQLPEVVPRIPRRDTDHDLRSDVRGELRVGPRPEPSVAHLHDAGFGVRRRRTRLPLLLFGLALLGLGGFTLLDTQFVTEHLRQFGTIELERDEFQVELEKALQIEADFNALPSIVSGAEAIALPGYEVEVDGERTKGRG